VATAVDAPYYHTAGDTPDRVDVPRLEETVLAFDRALDQLMTVPAERFGVRDPALWRADVELRRDGDSLVADVRVRDGGGRPPPAAAVEAVRFEDDFFELATARAATDGAGTVTLHLPAPADRERRHFLHVSAGARWPLVEVVRPV
jgi:hypothetical protein